MNKENKRAAGELKEKSQSFAAKSICCAAKMLQAVAAKDMILADYYRHESGKWGAAAITFHAIAQTRHDAILDAETIE